MTVIRNIRNSKFWVECGEQGKLVHFWLDRILVQPLWKNTMEACQKLKVELSYDPASEYLSKESRNTNLKRYMHAWVHCGIIYNSWDMETVCTHWRMNGWRNSEVYIYIHSNIYFNNKKWNLAICETTWIDNYATWNKLDRKRQIQNCSFFFWQCHTACSFSSLTRDQTQASAVKVPSPNYRTTREFPKWFLLYVETKTKNKLITHKTLCKLWVYNFMIWCTYILWNVYHNKVS